MPSSRSDHAGQLGRCLAELSDAALVALLAGGEPLATGIGGSTARIRVEGAPVFVKQIPLTAAESLDVRSTANHFDLPMACHYGIGSPGFGAGRELAVHELTSRWVHEGETDIFPLLLHWRVLERKTRTDTSEFEGASSRRRWGAHWPRVHERVTALREAESSVLLFLEHVPETLETWLRARFAAGAPSAGTAFAKALEQVVAVSGWMRSRGLRHLDVHPQNILVRDGRLLLTDFGLSLHHSFALDHDERVFADSHADYDHDAGVTSLLHWTLAELGMVPRARRTVVLQAAADGRPEGLAEVCAPLEGAADLAVEHATTAAALTEMFDLLRTDASATPYDLRRAAPVRVASCHDGQRPHC